MPLTDTQPDAVARIYARALYELCESDGRAVVEETLSELEEVLNLARSDAKFGEFLASRSLGADARGRSLERIFRKRVSDRTLNFLLVLNDKGRIGSLSGIADAFDSIVQDRFGRVEVDVYTASPIGRDASDALRAKLQHSLGKEVIVHCYTEPAMLGGVKFRIGDQLIDASVATRLRRIKDQLETDGASNLRARISKIIED